MMERTYNVPLRKAFRNTPDHKKAKKAITALRNFVKKHMKAENVRLGQHVNQHIWQNGMKNPPHHVEVDCVKEGDTVDVELAGHDFAEATRPVQEIDEEGLMEQFT